MLILLKFRLHLSVWYLIATFPLNKELRKKESPIIGVCSYFTLWYNTTILSKGVQMDTNKNKLLTIDDLTARVTKKRSTIYQKIKDDKFPKPIIQRPKFTRWAESDIDLYINYLQDSDDNLSWSQYIANNKESKDAQ